jgi:hypothetical protein
MHTLTLFYSVRNGGDGSAYPTFMSTQALADYDQDNMDEGWGESCTGSITLKSESPIIVDDDVVTPESYLIGLIDNNEDTEAFLEQFFPQGKPQFTVTTRKTGNESYMFNDVFVNGIKLASIFRNAKSSGQVFQDFLNQ